MPSPPLNAFELDKLQSISAELSTFTQLDTLCWQITRWIEDLTGLDDCVVYVRLGNVLTQMAALGIKQGDEQSIVNRIGLPMGVGIVGHAALSAQPAYVEDVAADDRYVSDEYPGASEFAVPLVHRGEVVGVLDSESNEVSGFSEKTRQLLQSVAVLTAPHVAELITQADGSKANYSEVISDLAHLPRSPGSLRNIFANITERAARTLRAPRVNCWLFNDDRTELVCIDHFDLRKQRHEEGARLKASEFPAYFEAMDLERVIIANDAYTDARTAEFGREYLPANQIYAMLDAPIRQDGDVVGVICIEQTGQARNWTNDEASFVATLSDLATIALISESKFKAERALIQAQKMESLGRLAGGVAHDFNNLLTVISGAVETLQLKQHSDPSTKRLLDLVLDAAERGGKLTKSLTALGGHQHLEFKSFNIGQLGLSIQRLTESVCPDNIHLVFTPCDEECWTRGDIGQLEQVLLNLILNSIDALPDGGEIQARFECNAENVLISVIDNGVGMSEEIRERIYDPFFTTKGEMGTGLGLAIGQGIVRQHKGQLTCTSHPGQGTTFTVQLPRTDPSEDIGLEEADDDEATQSQLKFNKALLVEDELGVRNVVSQMLQAIGYNHVSVAESANHAVELLEDSPHDILISDVVMPDMRGPDLYREALTSHPDLKA